MSLVKTKQVLTTYYDCGIEEHTHKNEVGAINCINKRMMPKVNKDFTERNKRFIQFCNEGKKYEEIAIIENLSKERVRQIFDSIFRRAVRKHYNERREEFVSRMNVKYDSYYLLYRRDNGFRELINKVML